MSNFHELKIDQRIVNSYNKLGVQLVDINFAASIGGFSNNAYGVYIHSFDMVGLSGDISSFMVNYVALHELAHATGHHYRLNRPSIGKKYSEFTDDNREIMYHTEEMCAHLVAMELCKNMGFTNDHMFCEVQRFERLLNKADTYLAEMWARDALNYLETIFSEEKAA